MPKSHKWKPRQISQPWLRALAGLSVNLSAGWFGVAFIVPNYSGLGTFKNWIALIWDILLGIIFLVISVYLEKRIK